MQFPVLGKTYSIVVLTEQRVNSRLYREIEVPLWEVRNATIFNTTFSYEPPYLIHHHIPPRNELPDDMGFALADLVVDSLNTDAGHPRYTISHYGNAERQCLDIDDTDLFYELDDATGRVRICLSYVHFACEDNLPSDKKAYTNPRLFIAAVYTDPNKVSKVVSVMDLQTTKDVDFAALKRVVHADDTWSQYYSEFASGKEPWVFLFLALLIACVGIGTACMCNRRGGGGFFKNDVEMRENVSLKYESAKLVGRPHIRSSVAGRYDACHCSREAGCALAPISLTPMCPWRGVAGRRCAEGQKWRLHSGLDGGVLRSDISPSQLHEQHQQRHASACLLSHTNTQCAC